MHILLTGASGTVGRKILEKLAENSQHDITVFDLPGRKRARLLKRYKDRVKIVYGNISHRAEIEAHCKGVDFVIHLAAIIPPLADEKPDLALQVNVHGTQNLISSLELHSPHCFFLYASSVSVYGDRLENPFIQVGDPLQASVGDEYAKTKIEAERLVRESKLDWSIFRLSAIMGTGNHKVSGLLFHMPLASLMEITTPEDTAKAFVQAISQKALLSKRIFNLGGGEDCSIIYRDFLSRSFLIFGLGNLDFPEHAFAEKNFHCGLYKDGDELEQILHFRNDDITSYFQKVEKATSPLKKFATSLFARAIKNHLLKQSEPYHAYHEHDEVLLDRFFQAK